MSLEKKLSIIELAINKNYKPYFNKSWQDYIITEKIIELELLSYWLRTSFNIEISYQKKWRYSANAPKEMLNQTFYDTCVENFSLGRKENILWMSSGTAYNNAEDAKEDAILYTLINLIN